MEQADDARGSGGGVKPSGASRRKKEGEREEGRQRRGRV
jgi:hypothetical protein